MREELRGVDWRRVFDDIVYLGVTGEALAVRLGLRLPLMLQIAAGQQMPASLAAGRIAWLWAHLTGKSSEFLPRTAEPPSSTPTESPALPDRVKDEDRHAQLQAIVTAWGRLSG